MTDDTMTPAEALAKGWVSALGIAASLCRERVSMLNVASSNLLDEKSPHDLAGY